MSKPHQKRPKQRALRSATQDRQRPESHAQRQPAPVSAQPWVTCIVFVTPEGCEVWIVGDGISKIVTGPGARSAMYFAGEALHDDYQAKLDRERAGQTPSEARSR